MGSLGIPPAALMPLEQSKLKPGSWRALNGVICQG
jgi:hypothetical protein